MPDAPRRPVVMGRVLAPFGVRGWVKIEPFTERPGNLGGFARWWLSGPQGWREMAVAEWSSHGDRLVARFEGCNDREEAVRFRGCDIAVPRESLPELAQDEYYQADLIGLRVLNRAGEELGRIEEVVDNGGHPVLRVVSGTGVKQEVRLLPLVRDVLEQVDLESGVVRVDWGADW